MSRPSLWPDRVPDAIVQFNALEHDLVTRRDLESLLGVSRPRAAELMREFGAERVGSVLAIKRPKLLRRFRALLPNSTERTPVVRRASADPSTTHERVRRAASAASVARSL